MNEDVQSLAQSRVRTAARKKPLVPSGRVIVSPAGAVSVTRVASGTSTRPATSIVLSLPKSPGEELTTPATICCAARLSPIHVPPSGFILGRHQGALTTMQ